MLLECTGPTLRLPNWDLPDGDALGHGPKESGRNFKPIPGSPVKVIVFAWVPYYESRGDVPTVNLTCPKDEKTSLIQDDCLSVPQSSPVRRLTSKSVQKEGNSVLIQVEIQTWVSSFNSNVKFDLVSFKIEFENDFSRRLVMMCPSFATSACDVDSGALSSKTRGRDRHT